MSHAIRSVRRPLIFAAVCWVMAVIAGFTAATVYEQTSAAAHHTVKRWPAETRCRPPSGKPLLVVFIHPKCPCTRASLVELAGLHHRCQHQLDLQFVFLQPAKALWRSEDTEHWRTVHALHAVTTLIDTAGSEHHRFGATTSGEVFLYTAAGDLAFHGGVTVGRGHSGESAGREAIEAIVRRAATTAPTTPVYGCALDTVPQAVHSCSPQQRPTRS